MITELKQAYLLYPTPMLVLVGSTTLIGLVLGLLIMWLMSGSSSDKKEVVYAQAPMPMPQPMPMVQQAPASG